MQIETLAQLIAMVESGNNNYAIRFEPTHTPKEHFALQMKQVAKLETMATARTLCSMSWGKYQIMGDELIALGLNVSPLEYVQNDAMQDEFFSKYCAADHLQLTLEDVISDESKRMLFARLYNGPGNVQAYAQRMINVFNSEKAQ